MALGSLSLASKRRRLSRRLEMCASLPEDLAELLWKGDVDRLLCDCPILQTKPLCTVGRLNHGDSLYTLKRHTWGRLSRTARMLHRESAARKCWRLGRRLAAADLTTPLPRACVDDGFGPLTHRSYLLTDYVPGVDLYGTLRRRTLSEELLTRVAEQVVGLWEKLAKLGCSHNDLKPENFILDDQFRVWLIDLEKARFHRSTRGLRDRQKADLERLFHPRVWYDCLPEARLFLDLFADAGWGELLAGLPVVGEQALASKRLTVLIRGDSQSAATNASVGAIADEVVPVAADYVPGEQLPPKAADVIRFPGLQDATPSSVERVEPARDEATTAEYPADDWYLLVEAGDRVTPDLAWEIQQEIATPGVRRAYRIPREALLGSGPLLPDRGRSDCELRLFHRSAFLSDQDESVESDASPEVACLENRIEYVRFANLAALIAHLDACATWSAASRYRRADEARLLRRLLALPWDLVRRYVERRYWELGWNGLQLSVIETAFAWIEEAKLWQQSRRFAEIDAGRLAGRTPHRVDKAAPVGDRIPASGRPPTRRAA